MQTCFFVVVVVFKSKIYGAERYKNSVLQVLSCLLLQVSE